MRKIGDIIKHYKESVSKSNADVFLSDLLGLVSSVLQGRGRESINIVLVYYYYFQYILPIIFDMFNTQGLKNKKQHIKRLNTMVENELMDIEGVYSKALSDFISGTVNEEKEAYHSFALSFYEKSNAQSIQMSREQKSVGFLGIEENMIDDQEFVHYIKELYREFPDIIYKGFYFGDKQREQIENIFNHDLQRVECYKLTHLSTLEKEIDLFIANSKSSLDCKVYSKLIQDEKIGSIYYNAGVKEYTVESIMKLHKDENHSILRNPEYFGFSQEDLLKKDLKIERLLCEPYIENISNDENMYNFIFFRVFKTLLDNAEFMKFFMDYQKKEILYAEEEHE